MTKLQQVQEWVLKLNNNYSAGMEFINLITGILVVVTLLSVKSFKNTPSAQMFKYSKPIYYSACTVMLFGVLINRFIGFPPTYPLTSFLYLLAYILFCSYILYAGTSHTVRRKAWEVDNQYNLE